MSYNGSGVWTTPAGNPVATGTVIQTTWANTLVDDIKDTFNNSLPRDGQAPMAGVLKLTAGTNLQPGLAFNAESSTGLYYPASGSIALTALGVEVGRFKSTGSVLIGSTTDSGEKLQVTGTTKITGATTLTAGTASTTTGTGTLVVTGGVGVSGAVNAGSTITGTALTPTGSAVPTNGLFLPLSSQVAISANSTEIARFTTAGVGIGMAAGHALDITKNLNSTTAVRVLNNDAGATADSRLILSNGTNVAAGVILRGTGHATEPGHLLITSGAASAPIGFYAGGTRRVSIETSGELNVLTSTSSTTPTTGSLITAGGVGIAGALNAGGIITTQTELRVKPSTSTFGYATVVPGTSGASGYYASFSHTGGIRQGYLGYATTNSAQDAGTLRYVAGAHSFTGAVTGDGAISAAGLITSTQTSSGTTVESLRLANLGAGGNTKARMNFYTTGTNYASITGGYGASSPELNFAIEGVTDGAFTWTSAAGERMRIASTGAVTIGGAATAALTKLDVGSALSAGAVTDVALFSQNSSSSPTIGQGARIHLAANNSITRSASVEAVVTSGINGHDLVFKTNANGASGTEKLRIATDGTATMAGNVVLSRASSTTVTRSDTTGYVGISGGTALSDGMNFVLGGTTTSAFANTAVLRSGNTELLNVSTTQAKVIGLDLVLPKTSGKGIKVDTTSPTYPWVDLLGQIIPGGGGVSPAYNVVRNGLRAYQFSVNDEFQTNFHLPHDYAPGTDIYVHVHWLHASAAVTSGGVTWSFESTYAKGHNQAAFPASVTTTVTQTASTTQYQHMVAETVISQAGGSATLLNSTNFEPDGVIMVRCWLSGNTMNTTPEPYGLMIDLHYQSTGIGTKAKAPNFYV